MVNLYELKTIADELKSTSGRLGKEDILKREISNEDWKQFLKYVYDGHLIYGLQKKKINKFLKADSNINKFSSLFEVFEYLLKNPTGNDHTASLVASYINSQPIYLHEFIIESICKSLKCGIDTTINKVYGKGFISKFEVMLAKDFYKESHKVKGDFTLTEKIDGQRAIVVIKDGNVTMYSRQGKLITGLIELEEELGKLKDSVLDGELLIQNEQLYKDREVLQETLKITRSDDMNKRGINLWVFDYLTNEEFENGKSENEYIKRREIMQSELTDISNSCVKLLPVLYQGDDLGVIPELLLALEDKGKEGLMLNTNSIYESKRSSNLLKIKTMKTMDIRIIGFEEGSGKYQGMLGNLILDYKGYVLRSGSGLNDSDRVEMWNNQSEHLNKIAEIQYFRESQNSKGELSVSFPVFLGIRHDKDEPSYH